MTELIRCTKCKKMLDRSNFRSKKIKPDELFKMCNHCREISRDNRRLHKDEYKEYIIKNKERILDYGEQYRDKHRDLLEKRKEKEKTIPWDENLLLKCQLTDKKYNREFDLDLEFIHIMYEYQGGLCCICGEEMLLNNENYNPQRISIDRVDTKIGRLKTNCVLTCWKCNHSKNKKVYEEYGCDPDCIPRYEDAIKELL